MEFLKDLLTLIGIPGALLAAWKAVIEFRNGNREKARENRLRQAAAARDALRELFGSEKSRMAMQMLDWSGRTYRDREAEYVVEAADLGPALRTTDLRFDAKERLIRDCFEDLFDRLELVGHYVDIDFLNYQDVAVPVAYYAKRIVGSMAAFLPFLDTYGYPRAKALLLRAAE